MQLLIDADGCPVVDLAITEAVRLQIPCTLVCDTAHQFDRPGVRTIVVSKGADSADFMLVNLVHRGDLVVTQDYGLAAMCLARGAFVINQDGMRYDDQNIDALLLARHTAKKIRMSGGRLKGPKKRTPEQNVRFREALVRMLSETKRTP
ncbi:YaiI/YqxD family protein [Yeguia hominis]|uniref:UPF0178 protein IAG03_04970 n=1 Tax=Yeguia hominis TaxID=2763662 RepID=A0A926D8N5_9FIRM|nr:YaiI/YqxD family protein [Yeguia hominis]MBC8533367.1 YaiI/YqxD family protein [Yeguia hominis]